MGSSNDEYKAVIRHGSNERDVIIRLGDAIWVDMR